jgi:hypothetical protein
MAVTHVVKVVSFDNTTSAGPGLGTVVVGAPGATFAGGGLGGEAVGAVGAWPTAAAANTSIVAVAASTHISQPGGFTLFQS